MSVGEDDGVAPAPPAPDGAAAWRRTSPRVLIVAPLRNALLPLLTVLGLQVLGGAGLDRFAVTGAVIALAATVPATLAWARRRYRVTGGLLELEHGVLTRARTAVPVARIRGLDATAPALYRPLGLARVRVESASGAGDDAEVVLDGLDVAALVALREAVLGSRRAVDAAADAGEGGAAPEAEVLARARTVDLLRMPLTGRGLVAPIGLAGAGLGVILQSDVIPERDAVATAEQVATRPVLVVLLVAGAVLLVPLLAAVGSLLTCWSFALVREREVLASERGALTRRHVRYEASRLRGVELVEALPARLAGLAALDPLVTGVGRARGDLLPVARVGAAESLREALVGPAPALVAHPPGARRRRLVRAVAPPLALAVPAALFLPPAVALALVALAAAGVPLARSRHAALGHGVDGRLLATRHGALVRSTAVVERDAVVGWTLRQSPFQRRAGVVTAHAGIAAGKGAILVLDAGPEQVATLVAATLPAAGRSPA